MKIVNKIDGSIHIVRKYIEDNEGIVSIWSNTWYGRHVVGKDCELIAITNSYTKEQRDSYAEEQADFTYRLFIKPLSILNQLTKAWQKETKQPHTLPDMTEFCSWIVKKMTETPKTVNTPELLTSLIECRENLLRYIPNCAGDGSHNGNVLKRVEKAIRNYI